MTTDVPVETHPDQARTVEEKIELLRKLFADAPEVGRTALENVLSRQKPPPPVQSAGRVGSRLGKVSELTIIVPFAPGGADRLRAFLRLFGGNLAGADDVGTLHDMRFVFLDNDTRMLFATAYDGDWDAYIDDFATKIPDFLDIIDSAWAGWPGIRSPEAKDYLARRPAKLIGRWRSGGPLTLAPDRDDPALGADPLRNNDFTYAADPDGRQVPLGSHMRRMNPRDTEMALLADVNIHRIIRRSTTFGAPYDQNALSHNRTTRRPAASTSSS